MIEAHTLDAWTRLDGRQNSVYGWAMIVGGFAAPGFLFLAGVALPLAAGSRLRRGVPAKQRGRVDARCRSSGSRFSFASSPG